MKEFTILAIEDDPDMLDNIRDLLEMNNYNVKVHLGGVTVLDRINALKPDLLIVDWMLPGMDGVSIVKHLRENASFKNTPCIMLTAKSDTSDIVSGYQHGVDVYLTKPFESTVLLAVVAQLKTRIMESEPTKEEDYFTKYDTHSVFVKKFFDLVAQNFSDSSIKLKEYAKLMCCSTSSLNAKINQHTGQSPYAIILEYRLVRSQAMLRDTQLNVTETAYACGFTSLSGFSIAYKKMFGKSPKNRNGLD